VSTNPYNTVPYGTFPRLETHPDRLATVGTLFGMSPAPLTHCRVLEIGCGDGNNLIPMAYGLPASTFVGIDLAEGPIAAGRRTIDALQLENIQLEAMDLRDLGPNSGEFDYILAHGVYSWVPAEVRDALLAVCRERLAPEGIALVSYNAMPGRHVRQMLREMMLYHTRSIDDTAERLRQARWFLEFFQKHRVSSSTWGQLLDFEAKSLLEHSDDSLFHDDLAPINVAVHFREFAEHALRHRLQYLGEAMIFEMFDPRGSLDWLKNDTLEREQYIDFLRVRGFRHTLLCREEVPLHREIGPPHMEQFLFASPARLLDNGQIEGLHGTRITIMNEAAARVACALRDTYPLPVAFEELVPYAGERAALQEILFSLVQGGFANPHVYDFPCQDTVAEKPRASRLVRYQAGISRYVTNACYHVVELDEIGRYLIGLLDGARTQEEIALALSAMPNAPEKDVIREGLAKSLDWFAREALLE
jgi:methyltransferase-like protein